MNGTTAAAGDAARFWAGDYDTAAGRDARLRDASSSPVTVAGVAGTRVDATVDVPVDDTCDPPSATIRVVALPSAAGGSVVWVLLTDHGAGVSPPQADLDRMTASIRPSGLGCDSRPATPGRWC